MHSALPYLIASGYVVAGGIALAVFFHTAESTTLSPKLLLKSPLRISVAALLGIAILVSAIVLKCLSPLQSHTGRTVSVPISDMETSCPPPTVFDSHSRVEFGAASPVVNGYPSTGGLLRLPFDFAVAEFLGISRLQAGNRSENAVEEDAFCHRLRLLGAQWWESYDAYVRQLIGFDDKDPEKDDHKLIVGWPTTGKGVWILRLDRKDRNTRELGKLGLCLNMDERCSLLEEWGGQFIQDPSTVPEFKDILEHMEKTTM